MAYHHIFGPVLSRRLGVSLGVDLVFHKVCSMDCIYCECGKTTHLTRERKPYVPLEAVIRELDDYFSTHPDPDYITFSGSGEPSLNSHLGEVITHIKEKKPAIRVAVLTNAVLMTDPLVRKELKMADLVVPSLDAAGSAAFQHINRPVSGVDADKIVESLAAFRQEYSGKIWLEVLILPGVNNAAQDLLKLKEAVHQIRPDRVQLNTLDRPGTCSDIRAATRQELDQVSRALAFEPVEIIASVADATRAAIHRADIEAVILETVHRRPCTVRDLSGILGVAEEQLIKALTTLENENRISASRQERGVFYQTVKGAGK